MFRRTLIWLFLAALFMGAGGYLTVLICTVEGRLPFEFLYRSYFKSDSKDIPDGEYHGMFISILQPGSDVKNSGFSSDVINSLADNDTIFVQYRHDKYAAVEGDKSQGASIAISIPANRPIRILLSGVSPSSPMPCRAIGVAPSDNVKVEYAKSENNKYKYAYFKPKAVHKLGIEFSIMTFAPHDESFVVWCDVKADVAYESFTKREMEFSYFKPGERITSDGRRDISRQTFVDDIGLAKNYIPVSKIDIRTSVKGSNNLHFTEGVPAADMANFDIERVLSPDDSAVMEWEDIVQNQYRDIILVIIGTLLAFGVTFFIEALRPLIDGGKE